MSGEYQRIDACRACKNEKLICLLDLGEQCLSGIFPARPDVDVPKVPLRLVKCDETVGDACGLVQLEHTFDLETMYGGEYGYRSGLNSSMVRHLKEKAEKIMESIDLKDGDLVIDIAGNDGTFLGFFPSTLKLVSVNPTSTKFQEHIPPAVHAIAGFFSSDIVQKHVVESKASVVTSFSMFYDLEDPCDFAQEVRKVLKTDGIWVLEQSYMPTMMKTNSFDTICHEHLSYYGMKQLRYIMDRTGFKILDYQFNGVNGGSISLTVTPKENTCVEDCSSRIDDLIDVELAMGLSTAVPWKAFAERMISNGEQFRSILNYYKSKGYRVAALGASTKGNVTLQSWGIGPKDIQVVADVHHTKFGCFTPGTLIPIEDEDKVLLEEYDLYVVLPWHFRDFFMACEKFKGRKLLFPLPQPEVVFID